MTFVFTARRVHGVDPSGVSAAANGITIQIYSLRVVAHLGVQGTAAALIPLSRAISGDDLAREVADRIFTWGTVLGVILVGVQWFAYLPSRLDFRHYQQYVKLLRVRRQYPFSFVWLTVSCLQARVRCWALDRSETWYWLPHWAWE